MTTAVKTFCALAIGLLSLVALAQSLPTPADMWERATLYRDEWGVPHIYADSALTLGFAFGYAQAEDRLTTLLRAYRLANGRAAEVWGEEAAKSDEFARAVGHAELAARAYPVMDATTIQFCDGFAFGVNTWMQANRPIVPAWAEPVQPQDVLAFLHYFLLSSAPYDFPEPMPYAAPAISGNAWAVGPSLSASGNTLLAINPHGYYDGPFQWYEAHLSMPGLHAAGATICGLPVMLVGHNDVLGWCITPNRPDFADVYLEPEIRIERNPAQVNRDPALESLSLYAALMQNVRTYHVLTPSGLEPRQVGHLITERGPVIAQRTGRLFSWRAGGYGDFGGILQLANMAAAQNIDQFQAALTMHQLPSYNVIYGDRDGNILYLYNLKTGDKEILLPPEEQKPVEIAGPKGNFINWNAPVPGDKMAYAWRNIVPVSFLPSELNPDSGFVQACGNPPWLATADSQIKQDQWPPWLVLDRDTYRARRVRELLPQHRWTFEDMQALMYDTLVPLAVEVVPKLLDEAQKNPAVLKTHPDISVGLEILRDWKFTADIESEAMTFFHAWWTALRTLGAMHFANTDLLLEAIHNDVQGIRDLEFRAIAEAAKAMRNEFQTVSIAWGEARRIARGSQSEAVAGALSGEPIFTMGDTWFESKRWWANYGYTFAMIVEFGDAPRAVSVVPFGTSDNPLSPHYADQLELLSERRFKYTYFDIDTVQRHAQSATGRVLNMQTPDGDTLFLLQTAIPATARLAVSDTPPSALPSDFAAFSTFVTPAIEPASALVQLSLEVHVPATRCAPENLGQLSVYAYDPQSGWAPINCSYSTNSRPVLSASDDRVRSYAVLGPASVRVIELAKAQTIPIPKPGGRTFPTESANAEPPAEAPTLAKRPPRTPRAKDLATPKEREEMAAAQSAAQRPERKSQIPDEVRELMEGATGVFRTTDSFDSLSADQPTTGGLALREEGGRMVITDRAGASDPAATPQPAPVSPTSQAPQAETPASTPPVSNAPPPGGFEMVQVAPKAASPVAWGQSINLVIPDNSGSIHIETAINIQARILLYDAPVSPLPPGLVNYTHFVQPEMNPSGIGADIALTLRVNPASVSAENADKLAIYVFSKSRGWTPLRGHRVNAAERTYSGLDNAARVYAVLGPAGAQLKKPAPIADR